MQSIDLDRYRSISELGIDINAKYLRDAIYQLIKLIQGQTIRVGTIYRDTGDVQQYRTQIKYLNNYLTFSFEFDHLYQFLHILLYSKDQTKTYLKICLAINDDPLIQYVENDHSGYIPTYIDDKIKLKGGEYLINLTHCLLSFIGFSRIRLDDNSQLISIDETGVENRTKLWLYLLMTKGNSWYAKFGYEPCNISLHELQIRINEIKLIKLSEIILRLKPIVDFEYKSDLNQALVSAANEIVNLIKDHSNINSNTLCDHSHINSNTLYDHSHINSNTLCDCTFGDYTKSCSMEKFSNLTNNLMQSVFSKRYAIHMKHNNSNEECDEDSEKSIISNTIFLEFFWFDKFQQLFVGNVMQINNNISKWFYGLPNKNQFETESEIKHEQDSNDGEPVSELKFD
jgi:hypothetical protein